MYIWYIFPDNSPQYRTDEESSLDYLLSLFVLSTFNTTDSANAACLVQNKTNVLWKAVVH